MLEQPTSPNVLPSRPLTCGHSMRVPLCFATHSRYHCCNHKLSFPKGLITEFLELVLHLLGPVDGPQQGFDYRTHACFRASGPDGGELDASPKEGGLAPARLSDTGAGLSARMPELGAFNRRREYSDVVPTLRLRFHRVRLPLTFRQPFGPLRQLSGNLAPGHRS